MYELKTTNAFKRDLKAMLKQGKKLENLEAVVDLLVTGTALPVKYHTPTIRKLCRLL